MNLHGINEEMLLLARHWKNKESTWAEEFTTVLEKLL